MIKKRPAVSEPSIIWYISWADMITLMFAFFVALFDPNAIDDTQLAYLLNAFGNTSFGNNTGGLSIAHGKMPNLGNTEMSLPSMDNGTSLAAAVQKARSLFRPEIESNKVRITQDERGMVISLASDAFFKPASATINIEQTRNVLLDLVSLLNSDDLMRRKVRIEGHTDNVDVEAGGFWQDNWQLSTERAREVLKYLLEFGVTENRFQIAGFADTVPVASNDTPEGRAYNRRVDIVILDEGHL